MAERTLKSKDAENSCFQMKAVNEHFEKIIESNDSNRLILQRKASCACGGGCPNCQAKNANLPISHPDDEYEKEADAVADKVMRMPASSVGNEKVQLKPIQFSQLQRKCAACEKDEEEQIKRKESTRGDGQTAPPIVNEVIASSGQPLDDATRHFMESRIGYDFSRVQVHTDSKAAESAASVNALAYTLGNHIVFNSGQYTPDTERGKRLLAHELAHTVQQKQMNKQVQRAPKNLDPLPGGASREGEISGTWNAALRESPSHKGKVLADLPKGHKLSVIGGKAWLKVNTMWKGEVISGYISYELIKLADVAPKVPDKSVQASSKTFKIVAKSFIALVGGNIGFTTCQMFGKDTSRLVGLAKMTDKAYHENPVNDQKDKSYRLYSELTIKVNCKTNKVESFDVSPFETDSGLECQDIPFTDSKFCLQPPTTIVSNDKVDKAAPGKISFTWHGMGRPDPKVEPIFQLICARQGIYIWHRISGEIDCSGTEPSIKATVEGSQFPSHRLFIDNIVVSDDPQGNFGLLWDHDSNDPIMVR